MDQKQSRNPLRYAIVALWGITVVALGAFGWWKWQSPRSQQELGAVIGPGDYQLVTTSGQPFTQASLKGSPSAVFFGFTHCPEVCPTTLGDITTWQEALGEADQLRVFFVTVDPERDTQDQLGAYVSWAPGVEGVTGTPEEIAKALKAFRIYARKVPLDGGGYTMDHSAHVLLFDGEGRFFEPIGYQEATDRVLEKLSRLNATRS